MNLTRILCGLFIILNLLPLSTSAFAYVARIRFDYDEINDEIALCQLREDLLISYDMRFSQDTLSFRYEGEEFRLSEVNGNMLLQPGTQIFLHDIEDLYFEKRGEMIYVLYSRNGRRYERIIAGKGIYLTDFSDCAEPGDEYHGGEDRPSEQGE
ncbi:MAG: hypothetical protein II577_02220 [Erysipelotrichaceae bacterium]|nr:hypothetical protein [Erysipelotrichaceae bacterium]